MIRKLLVFAITSGLAVKAIKKWLERDSEIKSRAGLAADLSRWEDDGGAPKHAAPPPAGSVANSRVKSR